MTRMADHPIAFAPEPLVSAAGVLAFPARPLPVGSSAEDILARLYAAWFAQLVAYACDRVSEDDAEDAVQRAFIEVWDRYLRQGTEPAAGYEAVLFAAVRFRVFDYRRVARRRRFLVGKFFYLDELLGVARRWMKPESRQEVNALARELDKAIKKLPDRMRELQVLYRCSGLQSPEIARITGLAPTTVVEMLSRGNRMIRDRLERAGYAPNARRAIEKKENHND